MIEKGDSYEKIKAKNPSISEDDYKEFKIKCKSSATSESIQWGKEMRELNLGEHKLGPDVQSGGAYMGQGGRGTCRARPTALLREIP